jgi:hypothetical protein
MFSPHRLVTKTAEDYFYSASSEYSALAVEQLGRSTLTALSNLVEAEVLTSPGCESNAPSATMDAILQVHFNIASSSI